MSATTQRKTQEDEEDRNVISSQNEISIINNISLESNVTDFICFLVLVFFLLLSFFRLPPRTLQSNLTFLIMLFDHLFFLQAAAEDVTE